jgi:RNA polymerase sigma-70 factor (ECF subfamily)
MCRMVVLESRRGNARREALLRKYGDTTEPAEEAEFHKPDDARLQGCLAGLSERERSVLVLSFFAEKPADEVARELGLTAVNARVIRHRALLRLRECMEKKRAGR